MKRVVIIGGVAAGMSAASQLRRMKEKEEVEILVFEKGGDISYSACGMPYYLSGVVKEKDDLIARTKQEFEERNISVHLPRVFVERRRRHARHWNTRRPAQLRVSNQSQRHRYREFIHPIRLYASLLV